MENKQQVQTTSNNSPIVITMDEIKGNNNAMVAIESSKAIQEVQASLIISKRFPRNELQSYEKIINACKREGLASASTYTYARGGTNITGASIRLAEAVAQYWGNIDFGWRELERVSGKSTVQAYCWDKESNTRREQTFTVNHKISTKKGDKVLIDERDIYENNANWAARRMRACILALIPSDIVEDAVAQCEETLKSKIQITPERINKMIETFNNYQVNKKMIEKRLQRNIDAITSIQFVELGKIANSIRDGMSEAKDWFEFEIEENVKEQNKTQVSPEVENKDQLESFKKKVNKNKIKEEIITEDGEVIEEIEEAIAEPVGNTNDDTFPADMPVTESMRINK